MYTVVDSSTGRVLYCRFDLPTVEGEEAIDKTYSEPIPEGHELFFDFETETFYTQAI